jgi:hypothetical protein
VTCRPSTGTAGCLLANRLSADPACRVLLLEAGPPDNYHWIHIPVGYLYCIGNPRTDWLYQTEPDAGLNGRRLRYPRGKTLGGCSSINGMIYMRGQRRDYDQWAQLTGDDAWRWDRCLPDFMAHEHHYRLDPERDGQSDPAFAALHGNGHVGSTGEWRVEKQRLRWDILDAFAQAAQQAGIPASPDFNGGNNEGVGYFEVNQKAGWRWNASKAFLRPVRHRPNLTVWTGAQAQRLLLARQPDGSLRCTGAEVLKDGHSRDGAAAREVVLSAGSRGFAAVAAALGHRPGRLAAGARHRGAGRPAGRGRQPARPPADPRGVQGAGRENPQHPGQQPVGQGPDRAGIRAQAQRAHEHGAQPARGLHPQFDPLSLAQCGIPRAAAEPGRLRRAAAPLPGVHRQRVQPQPHQPGHGADPFAALRGRARHCAQLPVHPEDRRWPPTACA